MIMLASDLSDVTEWKDLGVSNRTVAHSANRAVKDVEDALVEMVTNADDRYQQLNKSGIQQIEIELLGGNELRVRDFADGMTSDRMKKVIGNIGGRVSGMQVGAVVRGGNSKGAKDIANLGPVTFESVAVDGKLHKCQLNEQFQFRALPERSVTPKERSRLGIPTGTGTLVTIKLKNPRVYSSLKKKLKKLRVLEPIMNHPNRLVTISDGKESPSTLQIVRPKSKTRLKESFEVPGYPGRGKVKLTVHRQSDPFPSEKRRFRTGQIALRGKHGVHTVTMFSSDLEKDPAASRLWGTLDAPHIDELYKEWDDDFEAKRDHPQDNPIPILDLDRKGVARTHPYIKALFKEAEKRLRRIVEEERKSQQGRQREVLTKANKAVLDKVAEVMTDLFQPTGLPGGGAKPYILSPPFTEMIVGQTIKGSLKVNTALKPGIVAGDEVLLKAMTSHVTLNKANAPLVASTANPQILEAEWQITATSPVVATGIEVSFGNTIDTSTIEVFASWADKYKKLKDLEFNKKALRIRAEKKGGRVKLRAPLKLVRAEGFLPTLTFVDKGGFEIAGQAVLKENKKLGIAVAEFSVRKKAINPSPTKLLAKLGQSTAVLDVRESPPQGGRFDFQVVDRNFGSQRAQWNGNILEIAARHPTLSGYLGDAADQFPGQTKPHFLIMLTEIAAYEMANRDIERSMDQYPEQYEGTLWQENISEFDDLFSKYNTSGHEVIKSSVLNQH